jgi:HD superfamily phosphodiesterase
MPNQELLKKYLKKPRLKNLYDSVREAYEKDTPISHNWDHVHRDIINAVIIGEKENTDMNIVLPAIILHDIGFLYETNPSKHHLIGAEKCLEWLDDWNKEDKQKIANCVKCYKGKVREFEIKPETLEEQVVHDADILEKVGYIGIAQGLRTFVEFAETDLPEFKSLHKISEVLSKVKSLTLYTAAAKEIAEERGGFKYPEFFEKLNEELGIYYS